MTALNDIKAFDLSTSDLIVWVFKKSSKDGKPVFNGRWIGISESLRAALISSISDAISGITETIEYDILAQNNEGSALTLEADETYIASVQRQSLDATTSRKATQIKQIENTDFYIVRATSTSGTLLAARKTNATWKTKRTSNLMSLIFKDQELDLDDNRSFTIEPYFDFFVFEGYVYIKEKTRFESVLSYKTGHIEAFNGLSKEKEFIDLFSDIKSLHDFVGTNKIHLRRAIAIREKGHYKNPDFMKNLRLHSVAMNLKIQFDQNGKIIPTPESCRDIFVALLDHRLDSRLSTHLYDVQSTEQVM